MSMAMVLMMVGGLIAGIYQHDINQQARHLKQQTSMVQQSVAQPKVIVLDGTVVKDLAHSQGGSDNETT